MRVAFNQAHFFGESLFSSFNKHEKDGSTVNNGPKIENNHSKISVLEENGQKTEKIKENGLKIGEFDEKDPEIVGLADYARQVRALASLDSVAACRQSHCHRVAWHVSIWPDWDYTGDRDADLYPNLCRLFGTAGWSRPVEAVEEELLENGGGGEFLRKLKQFILFLQTVADKKR